MTDSTPVKVPILPEISKEDIRAEIERRRKNKLYTVFPDTGPHRRELYPKHMEFLAASSEHKEVAFIAGNRTGKSEAMVYAGTVFLTGEYPQWWKGKRFNKPVNILVAGETAKLVRDSLQYKFIGPSGELGTGMIPYDNLVSTTPRPGVPDAVDTVKVRHRSGENSTLQFGSYDQGREAFQATERDVVLLDEEPPMAIYMECLMRTMTTGGIVLAAFTPLKGVTDVTEYFMKPQAMQ